MTSQQKVAIVTGASQGIGASVVKAFRDRNYRVIANSRSIKPSGDPDVIAVPGDISDRAVAERIVSEAMSRFGRIDTLVNNAGVFVAKPFTAYSHEDYASILAVNLNGFFHITQLAIAEMEKQSSGHIVNITTTLAEQAIEGVPSVLASLTKGGLNAATKSLAIEYAKRGIRVNAVAPTFIHTPGTEGALADPSFRADVIERIADLHRIGEPMEVAGAVVFLASPAATLITGHTLLIDGGWTAR